MPSRKKQPAPAPEPIDTKKALYDRAFADGQREVIRWIRSDARNTLDMHKTLRAAGYPARAARLLRVSEDASILARIIELRIPEAAPANPVAAQAWRFSWNHGSEQSGTVK